MTSRLRTFIEAISHRLPGEVSVDDALGSAVNALSAAHSGVPDDDRVLLKVAASAVAFQQQVSAFLSGEVTLDFREEAVLEAVLAHLREVEPCLDS